MEELKKKRDQLEKEVFRLTAQLKRSERKCNKQKIVYDKNMENLSLKMVDFEKSLLKEQLAIQNSLQHKDEEIKEHHNQLLHLQNIVEENKCSKCKCPIIELSTESNEIVNDTEDTEEESIIRKLPPLSLPVTSALPNISFSSTRPFRKKSKLSPVAEESELSFSNNLRHVHADTNPEQFHALLTSRLLGSDLDEPDRKNVTPVEPFDMTDRHNGKNTIHEIANRKVETAPSELNTFSTTLSESIICNAMTNRELICDKLNENSIVEKFSNSLANKTLQLLKSDIVKTLDVDSSQVTFSECVKAKTKVSKNISCEGDDKNGMRDTNEITDATYNLACEFFVQTILKEMKNEYIAQNQKVPLISLNNQTISMNTEFQNCKVEGEPLENHISSILQTIVESVAIDDTDDHRLPCHDEYVERIITDNDLSENKKNDMNDEFGVGNGKSSRRDVGASDVADTYAETVLGETILTNGDTDQFKNSNEVITLNQVGESNKIEVLYDPTAVSSTCLDNNIEKQKDLVKPKKKKKKKKKKRKNSVNNDTVESSSSQSDVSPELTKNCNFKQNNIITDGTLQPIKENNGSLIVDEKIDNFSDDNFYEDNKSNNDKSYDRKLNDDKSYDNSNDTIEYSFTSHSSSFTNLNEESSKTKRSSIDVSEYDVLS